MAFKIGFSTDNVNDTPIDIEDDLPMIQYKSSPRQSIVPPRWVDSISTLTLVRPFRPLL